MQMYLIWQIIYFGIYNLFCVIKHVKYSQQLLVNVAGHITVAA